MCENGFHVLHLLNTDFRIVELKKLDIKTHYIWGQLDSTLYGEVQALQIILC